MYKCPVSKTDEINERMMCPLTARILSQSLSVGSWITEQLENIEQQWFKSHWFKSKRRMELFYYHYYKSSVEHCIQLVLTRQVGVTFWKVFYIKIITIFFIWENDQFSHKLAWYRRVSCYIILIIIMIIVTVTAKPVVVIDFDFHCSQDHLMRWSQLKRERLGYGGRRLSVFLAFE